MMSVRRKTILVADAISPVGVSKLEEFCEVDCDYNITATDIVERIADYNGLIVRSRTKVTSELIEIADQLEVVGRCGVGVDNIDIDACIQKGVVVVNSPRAPSIAVAELTIGLMLSLARSLPYCDREVKAGKWPKSEIKGFELYGKTLGVIAMGRIGTEVARLANAFNMRVIGLDPYVSKERFAEFNVHAVDYDELLDEADYISIHAPLTKETVGMIDMVTISNMKDGVRLISASPSTWRSWQLGDLHNNWSSHAPGNALSIKAFVEQRKPFGHQPIQGANSIFQLLIAQLASQDLIVCR